MASDSRDGRLAGTARARRDLRLRIASLALAAVAAGGAALHWLGRDPGAPASGAASALADAAGHARDMQRAEFDARFRQAVVMLHAREYQHALTALHRLLEIDPTVPEVHANMGFALLGLKRHAAARDFFVGAIELKPSLANAYYGLAVALEELGDRPGALGAMRTYVHLSKPDDPWLAKARSALWEWQSRPPAK